MAKVKVYGASDDLIEVDGAISEEFSYPAGDDDEGCLLAFSDGTVLRVCYATDGAWRITPVVRGSAEYRKVFEPANGDDDKYSDEVELEGDALSWVVLGSKIAKASR